MDTQARPEDASPHDTLTVIQAYDALIEFVRMHPDLGPEGFVMNQLSYGYVDREGVPVAGDQRVWDMWIDAVRLARGRAHPPQPDASEMP